jgi:hypothetical protein
MKSILFLAVIVALGLILYITSVTKEGFQGLNIPESNPPETPIEEGEEKPFAPPSTALLSALPGQTASVNSYPDNDPAMKKASAGRIQSVYTSVDGFLKRESSGLQEMGDPSVQLPLSTARSDANRLGDELAVMQRNPGLESSLTEEDLNGIEANYNYLEKKWRLSANSLTTGYEEGDTVEGFQSSSPAPTPTPTPAPTDLASISDLADLTNRINIEIIRLQASGSTNPLTENRIGTLTNIKNTINSFIDAVNSGRRKITDIKLTKTDIAKFLPVMTNLNSPIPAVLNELNMPPSLNNLFSGFNGTDVSGMQLAQQLFNKYADDIFRNLSWDMNLKYIGNTETELAKTNKATAENLRALTDSANANAGAVGTGDSTPYNGLFDSIVRNLAGSLGPGGSGSALVNRRGGSPGSSPLGSSKPAPIATAPGTINMPTHFDWKTRSQQICQQIGSRNYDPYEFGCLANPDSVSAGFSWRGYTRMICNRLSTIYDPGIPEACGCPPLKWPGWQP